MPSKVRASTAGRGYGRQHRALRARIRPEVERGLAVCARCKELIAPGEPWDLGHDDVDRRYYSGPEHLVCNRRGPQARRVTRRW